MHRMTHGPVFVPYGSPCPVCGRVSINFLGPLYIVGGMFRRDRWTKGGFQAIKITPPRKALLSGGVLETCHPLDLLLPLAKLMARTILGIVSSKRSKPPSSEQLQSRSRRPQRTTGELCWLSSTKRSGVERSVQGHRGVMQPTVVPTKRWIGFSTSEESSS